MKKNPTATLDVAELQRNPSLLLRAALIVAAYLFAFIILDLITKQFEELPGIVAWYPPAGLTYTLLLVFGVRFSPAVTIALFISSLFIYDMPQPPYALFLWAFIMSLIYSGAAAFLRHRIRFDWQLRKLRDVTWFVFTTVFVSVLLAVLTVSSSALSSEMPRSEILLAIVHWWIGETVGVLTVTPFLLIYVMPGLKRFAEGQPARSPAGWSFPRPTLSAIGQISSIALTLYWVFGTRLLDEFHPLFLITLPLIWIALQRGFKGVGVAILALNSGVVLSLWLFRFDLARLGELELLMSVNCIVGLLMGAVVTERNQAEEALRASDEHLRLVTDNMQDMVSRTDLQGLILYASSSHKTVLGLEPEGMLGKSVYDFMHPDDIDRVREFTLAALQTQTPGKQEFRYRHADGHYVWLESAGAIIFDEGGSPAGAVFSTHEITERKRAEDDLRRNLDRAKQSRQAMLSTLEDQKRAEEEIRRRANEFAALYETTYNLAAQYELSALLQTIADNAMKLLKSDGAAMYLYDSASDELELKVETGFPFPVGARFKMGEGMAGRVAQSREPQIVDDYQIWESRSPFYENIPFRAVAEVPMLYGGNLIGVLAVTQLGESLRKYSEADLLLLGLFASAAAGAVHSARLHEETVRQLDRLEALHSIDIAISASMDLRVTLNILLKHVTTLLKMDAADVLLFNPHSQMLEYAAGCGFRGRAVERARFRIGEGQAGLAALEQRMIQHPDFAASGMVFAQAELLAAENVAAYFALPLIAKGKVKGVLEVFHRAIFHPGLEWIKFLETLAGQAAIAIDNAQLFENLEISNTELTYAYNITIEGWSRALDLRDKETEGHSRRVTETTLQLAKAMGIDDEKLVHVRRGALLHDIGKMGVPDSILLKPGSLTDEEWVLMRKHPQLAFELLSPIAYLRDALDIPYCHHEKWDGTGYPRGLKGEQIPLTARIFAVVDVWDALISERLYRAARTPDQVREHILSLAGTHFDPNVVPIFLELMEKTLRDAQQK